MFDLRPAVAAELEAVVGLLERCALPRADIERDFHAGFVVADESGRIVGVAGVEVHGASGLLRSVAVAPGLRGRGLAGTLTRDRIAWARSRGLGDLWLLTTSAAPFFARLGFVETPRSGAPPELAASHEFATCCPASAVCMRLTLSAGQPRVPQ